MRRKASRFVYYSSAIPGFRNIVNAMHPVWLETKYLLRSRAVSNPPSKQRFKQHRPKLTDIQQRVVHQLAARGVSLVEYDELVTDSGLWDQMEQTANAFASAAQTFLESFNELNEQQARVSGPLQHNVSRIKRARTENARGDDYLIKLYPEAPCLSLDNPLLRFALSSPILNIVNSYLRLWAKLKYVDIWRTLTCAEGKRIGSQNWHRDRDDRNTVKVYLYFSTVDENSGPLQYVTESIGGRYAHLWPWRASDPFPYPTKGALEKVVPASDWITCVGSRGTIVFCDTAGLHRGGVSLDRPRLTATWTFVTPASLFVRRFEVTKESERVKLNPEARYAIS